MTDNELRDRAIKLRDEIRDALIAFHKDTGAIVTSIDFDWIDIQHKDGTADEVTLSAVTVDVERTRFTV